MNWWQHVININVIALESMQMRVEHWVLTQVLIPAILAQIPALAFALGMAWLFSRPVCLRIARRIAPGYSWMDHSFRWVAAALIPVVFPGVALIFLWIAVQVAENLGWPYGLVRTAMNLVAAWVVIRVLTGFIGSVLLSRLIALVAFTVAALNILKLLEPVILLFDHTALTIGGVHITLLIIVKALFLLGLLMWLAMVIGRLLEHRLRASRSLSPSMQVLFGKLVRILLFGTVVLVTLNAVGLDLTAFAVFTGAVGVGVGFGLQRVISNLVCGLILLVDKSIKPGDVIEVGNTFGWVAALGARYVAVTTRDGKEWLIPNEDLITNRVTNWSFSSDQLRLRIPLRVSFRSDVRLAMKLIEEAARVTERVLEDPVPVARLVAFGDGAVDLELRLWIRDPQNGIYNVQSAVLLGVWDRFREHNIQVPFLQRDIHIGDGKELRVVLRRDADPSLAAD
jgi:small-conductance mechanosensitive channel